MSSGLKIYRLIIMLVMVAMSSSSVFANDIVYDGDSRLLVSEQSYLRLCAVSMFSCLAEYYPVEERYPGRVVIFSSSFDWVGNMYIGLYFPGVLSRDDDDEIWLSLEALKKYGCYPATKEVGRFLLDKIGNDCWCAGIPGFNTWCRKSFRDEECFGFNICRYKATLEEFNWIQ